MRRMIRRYLKQTSTWIGVFGLVAMLLVANHFDSGSAKDVLAALTGLVVCVWQIARDEDKK